MRSLSARMLVISGTFAVLLTAAFALLIVSIQSQRSAGRAALRSQQALTAGQALEKTLVNIDEGVRGFVASGRESSLEPFNAGEAAYPGQLAALMRLESDEPHTRATVARIGSEIHDFVTLWARPMIAIARERLAVARTVVGNPFDRQRLDQIRRDFRRLLAEERAIAASRRGTAEVRSNVGTVLGVGGVALVLILTVAGTLYVRRSIIFPIRRVARSSEAVAGGDLAIRVPGRERRDEIGQLTRNFNHMTESLETSRARLDRRTAELERSNRDLEDFASVASHDMQGPLTTITMFSRTLQERLADRGGQEAELAGHITDAAGHLRALVRDLLAYAKLESRPSHLRAVELDGVLRQALDNLAGPIEAAGARIDAGPLPCVTGDPRRLCQVFQNLVGNAVKFSDRDHPVVEIRARVDGDRCEVTVTDNGIGFAPHEAERIFRPFQRLHSTDSYEGSGIGLAICERIVTQHGGRIWADSEPGHGATFHVELPLARADGPADTSGAPREGAGDGRPAEAALR